MPTAHVVFATVEGQGTQVTTQSSRPQLAGRVLIIDDDASLRFALEAALTGGGIPVACFDSGPAGLAGFDAGGADAVLTDLAMPGMTGLEVLSELRTRDPGLPVIVLTAHGSERLAVAAIKGGAYDYIPKPFDPDELVLSVRRALEIRRLRQQNALLRTESALGRAIVAASPAMRRVLDLVARVAPKDITILITGPSGAGKEVIAAALHAHSSRADKPFVRFNAAAIPNELAESELFGHARGAFTGAHAARQGYFQQANQGTLFIDEIGELSAPVQAKLLRALQSGEVHPVGSRAETVDVRLLAATNRDLEGEVRAGRFREDLFYRLNVVPIRVPPLAERAEDIEPLVQAFVRLYADRYGMTQVEVEPALMDAMKAHRWPGNVRELENTVARLLALSPDERLTLALWRSLAQPRPSGAPSAAEPRDPGPAFPLRARIEAFERAIIAGQFAETERNQSETARRLAISRPALIEKLHKYGLIGSANATDS